MFRTNLQCRCFTSICTGIVSDDDLDSIDFDGYLGRGMILTEWSENIADRLPKRYFSVIITKIGENSRNISVYYEER